eukprot:6235325-Alexandrium_andersonii.AAC.1
MLLEHATPSIPQLLEHYSPTLRTCLGLSQTLAAPLRPSRPVGEGRPPPQRLIGVPSEPPPNGRRAIGEDACMQLEAPRSEQLFVSDQRD